MERLLASRLATGQVIRMDESGGAATSTPMLDDLYPPALPQPQAMPKPRGIHALGARSGAVSRGPADIVLPSLHTKGEPQAPPGPWTRAGSRHLVCANA